MSAQEMPKAYEPAGVEKKWYSFWETNGLFRGKPNPNKKPYSIVIPPPNVTGILTMGHVLNNTLQDILMRWHRMEGYECCWFPGTDHAGIATEAKVNKELMKNEGITRDDLGRDAFIERVWEWKKKYGGTIIRQVLPAIGNANVSPWMRDFRKPCGKFSSNSIKKDMFTADAA